ncbi:WhiB family transcriptional regulator [Embleya sp. MST-111070]|uniref:WhiB family transcriptional regulator n=1 Tax=Embleya sp. MST-111070 TaxID=3398231 RepID=UPI003F73B641
MSIRRRTDASTARTPAPMPESGEEGRNWRLSAACIDLPEQAVLGTDRNAARPALAACTRCPVRTRCLAVVDPERTWFDGVSGGRLWRNGREVEARSGKDTIEEQS